MFPHEALDAYWYAEMLRVRALKVAADARCTSTIGLRFDSAFGRVIRWITEAADDLPERADTRLARARGALGIAMRHVNELSIKRGVRGVVLEDLREHASRLLARLKVLEGKPVESWPASNELPTVLDEVKDEVQGVANIDVIAALEKLPEAAVRGRPEPVVAEHFRTRRPANENAQAAKPLDDAAQDPAATKPPAASGGTRDD